MAGATHPTKSLYPKGEDSYFPVRIGGYAQASIDNATIDTFVLDCDCYVRKLDLFVREGAAGAELLTIITTDASKNLITPVAAVVNVAGVQQTLNSDIVDLKLLRGDKISVQIKTDADSLTQVQATVWLEPAQ